MTLYCNGQSYAVYLLDINDEPFGRVYGVNLWQTLDLESLADAVWEAE